MTAYTLLKSKEQIIINMIEKNYITFTRTNNVKALTILNKKIDFLEELKFMLDISEGQKTIDDKYMNLYTDNFLSVLVNEIKEVAFSSTLFGNSYIGMLLKELFTVDEIVLIFNVVKPKNQKLVSVIGFYLFKGDY